MANDTLSERKFQDTEQRYAFGKPVSNKYVFGVTNTVGGPSVHDAEQFRTASNHNTEGSQNISNYNMKYSEIEDHATPQVSSGDQESTRIEKLVLPQKSNGSAHIPLVTVSSASRVMDKGNSPDRVSDEDQRMKSHGADAKSKENAKSNYDYSDQVNRLKRIRNENQKSKDAEELSRPKKIAKTAVRAVIELKQREHIEVEARAMSILEMQTALMDKIAADAKESLREVYAKQMKEEIYAQYDKTAVAHKEAVESELIKQLSPEIKTSLKMQYAAQAKIEITKQLDEELRSEHKELRAALKHEVESKLTEELRPEVKTTLRAELTEQVKEELRKELKGEVYAEREKVANDYETDKELEVMNELIPKVEAAMYKKLEDEMRNEVREKFAETQENFELDQRRELIRVLRPKIEENLHVELTEYLTPLIKDELRHDFHNEIKETLLLKFEEALKSNFLNEVEPQIAELLTTQYSRKFGRAGGVRLTPEDQMQNELWYNFEAALKKDLFEEIKPQVDSILVSHYSSLLGQAVGMKLAPDDRHSYQDDMNRPDNDKSIYDGPTDRDLGSQNSDHSDDQYDYGQHRYQDDHHHDNADHRYQNDDYADNEERRDEQPSYHPSPSQSSYNEDLSFTGGQGDKADHVDEVEEEAPPSSTFRGVKRSRFEQEYDEDDYWGRSPKRARISGNGRQDEEESGEETTGNSERKGVEVLGSSKEDAIDLVDSESETEATAPKVAAPATRSGPFLEDSDDERYAQTEREIRELLGPRPESTGQDAQVQSSVGGEDPPEYESEEEL